jgi:hypothetical protein
MENGWLVLLNVDDDDPEKVCRPLQADDVHDEETRNRSAEPVSRMTS